jgi:hypothetical protein
LAAPEKNLREGTWFYAVASGNKFKESKTNAQISWGKRSKIAAPNANFKSVKCFHLRANA